MKSWCCRRQASGEIVHGDIGETVDTAAHDGDFIWCHIDGREDDERAWLETRSGLPATVAAALTAVETRPRSTMIGAGALINLRGLGDTPDDDPDPLVSIRLWAEKGRIISVSFRTLGAIQPVRDRMKDDKVRDPGDLISALAVAITEELDPEIVSLGDSIDACEEELDANKVYIQRREIARARSRAIGYRRFVVPQRQALERLAELDADWLEEDDRLHLREAADRFARMAEELESVRERSALLHEQLTDLRAEQIDTRTLLISIVALVFLPLTFLTGLLGMNVEGIPYAKEPWAFDAVLLLCLVIAALIGAFFLKAHWLRS